MAPDVREFPSRTVGGRSRARATSLLDAPKILTPTEPLTSFPGAFQVLILYVSLSIRVLKIYKINLQKKRNAFDGKV